MRRMRRGLATIRNPWFAAALLASLALHALPLAAAEDGPSFVIHPPAVAPPEADGHQDRFGQVRDSISTGAGAPLYAVNTHRAISNVALRHTGCVVDSYLKNQLLLTSGITTTTPAGPIDVRLEDGAQHEDEESLARPRNHFYDPTTNGGLNDIFSGTSSLLWAYDHPGNTQDWRGARQAYLRSLNQTARNTRLTELANTFYALGHVIHLVEDLAQPQHTRNDAHITYFPGSPYEEYASNHFGTAPAVSGLAPAGIPSFGTLPPAVGNIPPEFVAFWDTEQYSGQAAFSGFGATPGLAEFSNAFFITDDTMFGATRVATLRRAGAPVLVVRLTSAFGDGSTAAGHRYAHPDIRNTNLASFYPAATTRITLQREGDYPGDTPLHYVDLQVRGPGGGIVHTTPNLFVVNDNEEIGFDDVCYDSHARQLIPMAVSYAAGLMNYFFRGKIGLDSPATTWNAGEHVNEIEVTNDSSENFGAGTWSLYLDDASGNRSPVAGFNASGYGGSLGAGSSFTAKYPEMLCQGGRLFTLVFEGKIGNEVGAIAARSFYAANETWTGDFSIPASDSCIVTEGTVVVIFERPTPAGYQLTGWMEFIGYSTQFYASATCAGGNLQMGFNPSCGYLLSGTISDWMLTAGQTCCWYCPLKPPPVGPFFCGTVMGFQRTE